MPDLGVMRTQVRTLLGEPSQGFFTNAEIDLFLNMAQQDFQLQTLSLTQRFQAIAVIGDANLGFSGTLSGRILKIKQARLTDPDTGDTVRVEGVREGVLDELRPDWRNLTDLAKPQFFVENFSGTGAFVLILVPTPDKAYSIDFLVASTPNDLIVNTDLPPFRDAYHHALVFFAAAKMKQKDEEIQQAQFLLSEYNRIVALAKKTSEMIDETKDDRMIPEQVPKVILGRKL